MTPPTAQPTSRPKLRPWQKTFYHVNLRALFAFTGAKKLDTLIPRQRGVQRSNHAPSELTLTREHKDLFKIKRNPRIAKLPLLDVERDTIVRREPADIYIVNGIPMIARSAGVVDANKQKAAMKSNPETKIKLDHIKRGQGLVLSGTSGSIHVASTRVVPSSRREVKIQTLKMRKALSLPRFALHVINLVFHLTNLSSLHEAAESITAPDPQVAKFLAMRFRYFTTWVVMLHVFYSASTLALQLYRAIKHYLNQDAAVKYVIPKKVFSVEGLFRGILWPSTLVVTIFFWTLYNYDRDLIFPKFADEVVSRGSNHILHTWIAIFIILEVLVKPRLRPLTVVGPNLRAMFVFLALYMSVFYFTLFTEDIWLYPIFSVAYDSGIAYFLLLHLVLLALFLFSYASLWTVNDRFHKHRLVLKKKTQYYRIRWGSTDTK